LPPAGVFFSVFIFAFFDYFFRAIFENRRHRRHYFLPPAGAPKKVFRGSPFQPDRQGTFDPNSQSLRSGSAGDPSNRPLYLTSSRCLPSRFHFDHAENDTWAEKAL
jgi:hypothetical protein